MNTVHKYCFEFTQTNLGVPGTPRKRIKTVGGVNALDAQCRLRKILHREGFRIHLIYDVVCVDRPEPEQHLPGLEAINDTIASVKDMLANLERQLCP